MKERLRHYRIVRQLGEGGMGIVFEAFDERLERRVALKLVRSAGAVDEESRRRLWREARAAASVVHPGVCQVYEIGEDEGTLFIAMELLEGPSLAARIGEGPLPLGRALEIAREVALALDTMHRRGVVHRDLKPSNVVLAPHGVKLLDFGLARAPGSELLRGDLSLTLTHPGTVLGTPRYMAPEQWAGETAGPPADLFALGAILFEMLSGRPAFPGGNLAEVWQATISREPPPLAGGAHVLPADRVIQRALAKRPQDRYPDAAAMAEALLAAGESAKGEAPLAVSAARRLLVLPFRPLRPDPETEFLANGLPDAVTASLAQFESLVLRSPAIGIRLAMDAPDFRRIASEAEVDAVLTGTLLRAADRLRVSTQLIEVPSGTVLATHSAQAALDDIFQLQDDLARGIVSTLSVPLVQGGRGPLQRDVPASPRAYELYLRGNQAGVSTVSSSRLLATRDLYRECVREDPSYAPGWALLGRLHRVIAKYGYGEMEENVRLAQEAFERAFQLNPELPLAHRFYTYFEIEVLGRPRQAMVRLLEQTRAHPNDAELFAGLVTACRFCGLLEASLAADLRARRLEPQIRTSVPYTHLLAGDMEAARRSNSWDPAVNAIAFALEGDARSALSEVEAQLGRMPEGNEKLFLELLEAALAGRRADALRLHETLVRSSFRDPEGLLFSALSLASLGEIEPAMELLERIVRGGLHCPRVMRENAWLRPLHPHPRFAGLLAEADARHREAAAACLAAGGGELLGIPS